LYDLEPTGLAAALVEGIRAPAEVSDAGRKVFFDLYPLPNYFFTRDPQVVMGSRVVVSSMATPAREREPLLARTIFEHHPALAGHEALYEIDVPPTGAPQHDPYFPYPNLEGGDVLVASPEILLVGLSERTNRRGIETLAGYLRQVRTPFRHLVMEELAQRGWRILSGDEALSGQHDLVAGGPTAIALYSNELSRARGGPRCMTMPLERDPL